MNTSYANSQPSNPLNNINGVVPDSLKYVHKPSAIPAYAETNIYIPDNGVTFSSNLSPTINLPIRSPPNSFVDTSQSYILVSIKNTSKGTVAAGGPAQTTIADNKNIYFDNGNVSSIIRTLKIMSGGTTISELGNKYHTLASLLLSNNVSDDYLRVQSILGGCAEYDNITNGPSSDITAGNNFIKGDPIWGDINGETKIFIIPLISGFLNGSKMLPTHFTANSFITIQLGLAPANEAFIMKSSTVRTAQELNYEITNVKFYAKTVFLNDPSVMDRITGAMLSEGKLSMCVPEYSNLNIPFTIVAGGKNSISIPCRYQVLKSILCVMVPQGVSDTDVNTQGSKYGLTKYQFTVGGRNLQTIDTTGYAPQAYAEYLKCFNTLGNVNVSSNCSASTWSINNVNGTAGTPKRGSFCIAQNFENFAHTDAMESGMNTQALALNVNLNLEFDNTLPAGGQFMLCVFFNYDCIYELYGDSSFIVKA